MSIEGQQHDIRAYGREFCTDQRGMGGPGADQGTHTRQGRALVLVQRDEDLVDEHRLIGGRFESHDGDLLETIKREMLEELGLECGRDYILEELIHELVVPTRLSPTYGVLSCYHYRLYSVKMARKVQLAVGDNRWVSKRELLAGQMDSGEKIAAWHAGIIDNQLPGGLDGVTLSFSVE